MDTPPARVEDMTAEAYEDFVSDLYVAAREGAALHEIPGGSTDLLPTGDVRHGPWAPDACTAVLGQWHQAGLIGLHRHSEPGEAGSELAATEATRILLDPAAWVVDQEWASVVSLVLTDKGAATDHAQWQRLVSRPQ